MGKTFLLGILFGLSLNTQFVFTSAQANPYPDPRKVPKDSESLEQEILDRNYTLKPLLKVEGSDVFRVVVDWNEKTETYSLGSVTLEKSGTEALVAHSKKQDPHGSYRGTLIDPETKKILAYDSIGTGKEFRKLVRAITFRFPALTKPVLFRMEAEDPQSGEMKQVLESKITPDQARALAKIEVEAYTLLQASAPQKILVNIYSEGYLASRKDAFLTSAQDAVKTLVKFRFPGLEHFEIRAVFAPSQLTLGRAKDLGLPVPERNSFLGLYYPYWNNFGRWYHIVYPTRELRYRDGIGQVAYDYPIVLIDSDEYWGVGNFKELTAIPAENFAFGYLLLHEFGHYFGLNEEYSEGGRTELEFAPGITEPWSQNITFARNIVDLKWKKFVRTGTPLPTPHYYWHKNKNGQNLPYGAYLGGYAQSEPLRQAHKPGLECVMENAPNFCSICQSALAQRVRIDLGLE